MGWMVRVIDAPPTHTSIVKERKERANVLVTGVSPRVMNWVSLTASTRFPFAKFRPRIGKQKGRKANLLFL